MLLIPLVSIPECWVIQKSCYCLTVPDVLTDPAVLVLHFMQFLMTFVKLWHLLLANCVAATYCVCHPAFFFPSPYVDLLLWINALEFDQLVFAR